MKICNVCGKPFDIWDESENNCIEKHTGFGSKYDGMQFRIDMCCDCFDELMEYMIPKCKYSPIVGGCDGNIS